MYAVSLIWKNPSIDAQPDLKPPAHDVPSSNKAERWIRKLDCYV